MMIAASTPLTLDAFLNLSEIEESPAWEYIRGAALQKPMGGGKHSALQKRLVSADQASKRYEAFPELRCIFGDQSVVPDMSVLANEQIPLEDDGEIISSGILFAPLWVIEILSLDQSQTRAAGNILHCLRHGSHLGWLVDPKERSVLVYQPDCLPDLLSGASLLTVPEEIDFKLSAEELFGWLRRTR